LAFLDAVVDVIVRNKGLLAALGHAATTTHQPEPERHSTHPVYQFWHGHIAALITAERPDLDAELLAHMLLATLQHDPILRLMEAGEGPRLAEVLRGLATAQLDAAPKSP
jgi:hypothetical protein